MALLYHLTRRLLSVPTVLRRQITGQIRYEPADRLWFTAQSSLLPRHRWHAIFPVQPATITKLILRLANDNPR